MDLFALMSLGFVGLASGGFGAGGQIPIGARTYGDVNTVVVRMLSVEPQAPAAPAGLRIPKHMPSEFPFVVDVPDDGEGPAGGWQEAKANLKFVKYVLPRSATRWPCAITIQIPIRHSTRGFISPDSAANMSALVTNVVTINMDFELPKGIFCDKFVIAVRDAFPILLPDLGARVKK